MHFIHFLDNVKCPFVFWALFVKTLLYLCISYFTLIAFSMCASLVDMRMSSGIMCESVYFGGFVLF